ncbi:MAG: PEGA domain-containing protein [Patescibacteria group bacterium]
MRKQTILYLATAIAIAAGTVIAILIAQGYRLDVGQKEIEKSGLLLIESTPTDAKIFINGKLVDTTNATLSLSPKIYDIQLAKEGFSTWEKKVKIQPGLATEIDALLISTSPQLTPLTTTGVTLLKTNPQRNQIAYTTRKGSEPGLWILDLATPPLVGLVKENPYILAEDTADQKFSLAENLQWGPKGKELLITLNRKGHVLAKPRNGILKQATSSAKPTTSVWKKEKTDIIAKLVNKLEIPKKLEEVAKDPNTLWAPDEEKFLYTKERDEYIEYHIFNGENPLGVGRKRHYLPLKVKKDLQVKVNWHSTSEHLIIKSGTTVSLIEMEGTNKTEIFSGHLASSKVVPTPNGANLIVLTSFKQDDQPNFYAVSLR